MRLQRRRIWSILIQGDLLNALSNSGRYITTRRRKMHHLELVKKQLSMRSGTTRFKLMSPSFLLRIALRQLSPEIEERFLEILRNIGHAETFGIMRIASLD